MESKDVYYILGNRSHDAIQSTTAHQYSERCTFEFIESKIIWQFCPFKEKQTKEKSEHKISVQEDIPRGKKTSMAHHHHLSKLHNGEHPIDFFLPLLEFVFYVLLGRWNNQYLKEEHANPVVFKGHFIYYITTVLISTLCPLTYVPQRPCWLGLS